MKKTIFFDDFVDAFRDYDREHHFSRKGLLALWDYLEGYEEDTGHELDLDVIGLCCEFSEYESLEDYNEDRGSEYESLDELAEHTTVIGFAGGIVVGEH